MWIRETNFAGVRTILSIHASVYYDSHENKNPIALVISQCYKYVSQTPPLDE
jgi:hypothetical protein